jgi:hypothetical protein
MPIQLLAPVEKTFTLDISDARFGTDGEPTKVTIRQATQGAVEKRSLIYSEVTNVIAGTAELSAEMLLRQKWSIEELKRTEAFLTMCGCDLKDSSGDPLFRFRMSDERQILDMNEVQFKAAWSRLDPTIASEIHSKVLEVNPDWGGPLGR